MPTILTSCPVVPSGMDRGKFLLNDAKGTSWRMTEQQMLSRDLLTGPFHNDDSWLRQHFGVRGRCGPVTGLVIGIDIDMAGNFLIGACEMATKIQQHVDRTKAQGRRHHG